LIIAVSLFKENRTPMFDFVRGINSASRIVDLVVVVRWLGLPSVC